MKTQTAFFTESFTAIEAAIEDAFEGKEIVHVINVHGYGFRVVGNDFELNRQYYHASGDYAGTYKGQKMFFTLERTVNPFLVRDKQNKFSCDVQKVMDDGALVYLSGYESSGAGRPIGFMTYSCQFFLETGTEQVEIAFQDLKELHEFVILVANRVKRLF